MSINNIEKKLEKKGYLEQRLIQAMASVLFLTTLLYDLNAEYGDCEATACEIVREIIKKWGKKS